MRRAAVEFEAWKYYLGGVPAASAEPGSLSNQGQAAAKAIGLLQARSDPRGGRLVGAAFNPHNHETMNFSSRLFDRIRIGPSEAEEVVEADARLCDHPGCTKAGEFRAPMGRGKEGKFFQFCLEHVKAYNATYNYFAGMNDEALAAYAKQEEIGHRPTWKLGVNASAARMAQRGREAGGPEMQDAFNLFRGRAGREQERAEPRVGVLAKKALETLDLDDTADRAAIKARYKELVKRFHPDANGGDRSREGRLQEILKAYQTLKSSGLA